MNKHFATIVVTLNAIISIGFLSLNNWLPPVPERLEEVVEQRKVAATLCRNCTESIDLSSGEAKIDGKIDDNAQAVKCIITAVDNKPKNPDDAWLYFETPHLLFRGIRATDVDALYAYARNPEVAARNTWAPYTNKIEAFDFIQKTVKGYKEGYILHWGIEEKETGTFIGTAHIWPYDIHTMVGYTLANTAWNKGYELEIMQALIEMSLVVFKHSRITALARCDDSFSQNILKQAGMSCEGIEPDYKYINGKYVSMYHYALLKKEVDPTVMQESVFRKRAKSKA
jgi:ribosomal-protein-alanine N-acetyltransferase